MGPLELDVLTSFDYYYAETLSGRKLKISTTEQEGLNESVESLKKRIQNDFSQDSEVGDDFQLLHNGKMLSDQERLVERLLNDNNVLQVRRKSYSCFVEHLLSQQKSQWKKWVVRVICVIVGSLFISAMTQIQFHLPHAKEVPVTMQTFAVFLIASLLGWKMGMISVVLYLLEGIAGAPFFSSRGHGAHFMIGATSGYLYGFLLAAGLVGWLAERGNDRVYVFHWRSTFISMILGNLIIYIVGVPVLSHYIGMKLAVSKGLLPFLVGDLLKIILCTALIPSIWKLTAFIFNKDFSFKAGVALFDIKSNKK
ncbi:hypothetical protein DLAC_08040 [Tieghemostelium lacteum]|uniref:Ubiquitin-like domain-containing protein n=1 Tax=Tieghemostelium lacteum TaxID=361077 RepID=A0A151ZB06_TIELA|nr:hypothetical protein DLAC_08040 [Tieghemostelium lacteum]|eukprot:KYQ91133.1 hypothetical protein DLAC_08040 [Tieghemostelium lacteum]